MLASFLNCPSLITYLLYVVVNAPPPQADCKQEDATEQCPNASPYFTGAGRALEATCQQQDHSYSRKDHSREKKWMPMDLGVAN